MTLEKKNVKAQAKPNMEVTIIDERTIRDKIYERKKLFTCNKI